MSETAQLTITNGPDRGRVYDLDEEVVHIGHGDDNDIVLGDPSLADHQASIVSRNGRYAIFSPMPDAVVVGENAIPPDQWVWLPNEARIRLGERTVVQFRSAAVLAQAGAVAQTSSPPPPDTAAAGSHQPADLGSLDPFGDELESATPNGGKDAGKGAPRRRKRSRKRKRPESTGEKRKVARFVTDQTGDTTVTLGEDGQLPELQLAEGERKKQKVEKAPKEGLSAGIYVVLAFSMISSIFLLFADLGPGTSTRKERATARAQIRTFIDVPRRGGRPQQPQRYQILLREAVLAHGRGDGAAEREAYREVLEILSAEDRDPFQGVTGNLDRDEILREAIAVLLAR